MAPNSIAVEESKDSLITDNENSENVDSSSAQEEIGGGYLPCNEHTLSYHSVKVELLNYLGQDAFNAWCESFTPWDEYGRATEDISIASFIRHFNIPRDVLEDAVDAWASEERLQMLNLTRDEYLAEYGYTDAQIDALYSGDQAQINAAFCGEMAYYNPEDGELYSIYWLSDHTEEEYAAAGIPVTEVARILDSAEEAGGSYALFAEEAAAAAAAYALDESMAE